MLRGTDLFSADRTPLYDSGEVPYFRHAHPSTLASQKKNPLRTDGNFVEVPDPLNEGYVRFYESCVASRVVMTVIDDPWVRRLNEINQSASLTYLYPSARNSRFPHVVGVAALGIQTLRLLWDRVDSSTQEVISDWAEGFALALICHDLGHFAPGSHGAYDVLFAGQPDAHEALACSILRKDTSLMGRILGRFGHAHGLRIIEQACALISEDCARAPRFLVQLLSGGGWNVDRGDWVIRDLHSITGARRHFFNSDIQKHLSVTPEGSLVLDETAVTALESFANTRARLYWDVFNSPICRSFDHLAWAIAACARDQDNCMDELTPLMRRVFSTSSPFDLDTDVLFQLREHEWLSQRDRWCVSGNQELRFLAQSLRDRRGPCALQIPDGEDPDELKTLADGFVDTLGFSPKYHVALVPRSDGLTGDLSNALGVSLANGDIAELAECSSYFRAVSALSHKKDSQLLILPGDVVPDLKKALRVRRSTARRNPTMSGEKHHE